MAGYRPIGLSSSAGSTIIAGRGTSYADRRRAAAERLSKTANITQRLEAAVAVPATEAADVVIDAEPIDPDGTLRASIRALIPIAHRIEGFDVTVSLGPAHRWAVSIRRGPDGVIADLVPGAGAGAGAAGTGRGPGVPRTSVQTGPSEAEIVAELAALLWNGEVGIR